MPGRISVSASEASKLFPRSEAKQETAAILLKDIRDLGLPAPSTEVQFHPQRRWRFDFAWTEWLIAIEIDGGDFGRTVVCHVCSNKVRKRLQSGKWMSVREGGRHANPAARRAEREKMNAAAILGWMVLHYSPEEVSHGLARASLEELRQVFKGPIRKPRQKELF